MHIYAHVFLWLFAIVFGLFGWWVLCLNFASVYFWIFHRKHSSRVPLVGSFFAFLGTGACPILEIRRFALWPLCIDVGFFLLTMMIGIPMEIYARRKRRKANTPEKAGQ
jgi:hypothetical protein